MLLKLSQHQGKSFFGDGGVFRKTCWEMQDNTWNQMLGDGATVCNCHWWKRLLSQRRETQKIIEETPAPNLPAATRQKMIDAAESLASVLHYKCAGTVEYIYDSVRDEFYFLEVIAVIASWTSCYWIGH